MSTRAGHHVPLLRALVHVVLVGSCLLALVPIVYTGTVSLSSANQLTSSSYSLIPRHPTLDNFRAILFDWSFLVWLKNSLFLSLTSVLFTLAFASPAAYAYSRFSFRFRSSTLYLFLLLNAFPALLSMVAIIKLYRALDLMNTFGGMILVYAGSTIIFSIWNLKGYFDSIPVETEQAARIDGAGDLRILWQIVLPLARPALIVTGMMIFIASWNEYLFALSFLSGSEHYTLAVGLYMVQGSSYQTNWPVFAAGSLIVTLPVIAIFFLTQRHIVSGLTLGGMKY